MYRRILLAMLAAASAASAPAAAQRFGGGDPLDAFEKADRNGDGTITREEFAAQRATRFDRLDRNRDDAITSSDFGRLARFRPEAAQKLNALIEQADANNDGRATRSEFNNAPMPIFDLADSSRDGMVTADELSALKAKASDYRARK